VAAAAARRQAARVGPLWRRGRPVPRRHKVATPGVLCEGWHRTAGMLMCSVLLVDFFSTVCPAAVAALHAAAVVHYRSCACQRREHLTYAVSLPVGGCCRAADRCGAACWWRTCRAWRNRRLMACAAVEASLVQKVLMQQRTAISSCAAIAD